MDIPKGQWCLAQWQVGAGTEELVSYYDKKGRWWRVELDANDQPCCPYGDGRTSTCMGASKPGKRWAAGGALEK